MVIVKQWNDFNLASLFDNLQFVTLDLFRTDYPASTRSSGYPAFHRQIYIKIADETETYQTHIKN